MSLAEGDNPRPNRDDQLDLSEQIREEFGETVFIDDHNEQHFRRIMFHARGGLDRRPKCLQGSPPDRGEAVRKNFPDYDNWLNKKFKRKSLTY